MPHDASARRLAVLAALTFLNVARFEVNAALPPVSKNLNLSV
jgi:hypothetical protein